MYIKPPTMKEINALKKPWRGMSFFAGCGGSSTGHKMAGVDILISNEFIDIARLTYEKNHPSTKVIGSDIRRLEPKKLLNYCGLKVGELDLLDGSPPCFTKDTLIQTREGFKYIDSIQKGDMVLTHKQRYRPVVEPMKRQYNGPMHRIISSVSENLATPEHPFLVRRIVDGALSDATWVDAKDVRAGDKVAVPVDTNCIPDRSKLSPKMYEWAVFPEFWWMVGQWVANGSLVQCGRHKAIKFSTHSSRANQLLEQALDKLNITSIQSPLAGGKYVERFVMDEEFKEFLKLFLTEDEHSRQIPGFVLDMDAEYQSEFIFGYQSRCWSTSIDKALIIQARSERFMCAMRFLVCSAFGLPLFNYNTAIAPEDVADSHFTYLPDSPYGQYVKFQSIFFLQDDDRSFVRADDKFLWVEVLANAQFEASCDVFNFSVEEDETYIAQNTVVHNCKGFSSAGVQEDGWGKEVNYSEGVHQQVDDLFDQFCRVLEGTMPKTFTAENVSGLVKGASKGYFLEIMNEFKRIGYKVRAPLLNAAWLGVPQSRERIIFMGVREDIPFDVPSVTPLPTMAMLADALPHIHAYKGIKKNLITYIPASNSPMSTITAADAIAYETARFSSAGFIQLLDGTRRKLTIDELKVISGMPSDYQLLGTFEQQWERLGRVCVPAMTCAASTALIEHVLKPYAKKRKKQIGDKFR